MIKKLLINRLERREQIIVIDIEKQLSSEHEQPVQASSKRD